MAGSFLVVRWGQETIFMPAMAGSVPGVSAMHEHVHHAAEEQEPQKEDRVGRDVRPVFIEQEEGDQAAKGDNRQPKASAPGVMVPK
ncbi:MAG: hypothetical protein R3C98_09430 [Hyphomonas sp.]